MQLKTFLFEFGNHVSFGDLKLTCIIIKVHGGMALVFHWYRVIKYHFLEKSCTYCQTYQIIGTTYIISILFVCYSTN